MERIADWIATGLPVAETGGGSRFARSGTFGFSPHSHEQKEGVLYGGKTDGHDTNA
jgi:hypothetical protein